MTTYRDWVAMSGTAKSGAVVSLRPLHGEDIHMIGKWRNSSHMRDLLAIDYPVSYDQINHWLQRAITNLEANPSSISLGISVDGDLVGTCGIHGISLRHRHAMLGIYIGEEKFRKGGIGSAVYEMLLRFVFHELDLRCVDANVYGNNEPSQKLHLRFGFREVQRKPVWELREGKYQDFLTYWISKEIWLERQK
jgi:RimJ/RimL family protein N-acetyltransferase